MAEKTSREHLPLGAIVDASAFPQLATYQSLNVISSKPPDPSVIEKYSHEPYSANTIPDEGTDGSKLPK